MSLTAGLEIAKSGLSVLARETAIISRNVAVAGDPRASRQTAETTTLAGGGVQIAIVRATSAALFDRFLGASAREAESAAVLSALNQLNQTIGDPEDAFSPAALVGKLRDALQIYAEAPNDDVRAQAAVSAARNLTVSLNDATRTVQGVREQADAALSSSVERINSLLAEFAAVNQAIVTGSRSGADVSDSLDQRDRVLSNLAEEIGIRTVTRSANDMAIYTDSGVTLFDRSPRNVNFVGTPVFDAAVSGRAVFADGVPVTGAGAVMAAASGRIAGLAQVRDKLAPAYQNQLDEIARGLIEAFAETDQSAVPSGLPQPGLFTFPAAAGVPPASTLVKGLAGQITVAARADPAQGGDANRLRDGDISGAGAAYVYNATGAAGFSERIRALIEAVSENRGYDPAAGLQQTGSVTGYAASSASWLQEARRNARAETDQHDALRQRAAEALSNATGINLDEEMARLLELERAYQASSRLITTIDALYDTLFQALR